MSNHNCEDCIETFEPTIWRASLSPDKTRLCASFWTDAVEAVGFTVG